VLSLKLELVLDVRLNHAAAGWRDVRSRLFLAKKQGESLDHVLMKLCAYLLFYHPDLKVEVDASQHYRPDLVRLDERGDPVQWVDCGSTALRKLDRIASKNRKTTIDIVKPTARTLTLFKAAAEAKIERPERVRYFAFRDGFLNDLAAVIRSRHQLEATVLGDCESLEVSVDGQPFSSPIVRL
jgi:uncharacterized protein YaeQ